MHRAAAGRTCHPKGRSEAEDGAAVDAAGLRRLSGLFRGPGCFPTGEAEPVLVRSYLLLTTCTYASRLFEKVSARLVVQNSPNSQDFVESRARGSEWPQGARPGGGGGEGGWPSRRATSLGHPRRPRSRAHPGGGKARRAKTDIHQRWMTSVTGAIVIRPQFWLPPVSAYSMMPSKESSLATPKKVTSKFVDQ